MNLEKISLVFSGIQFTFIPEITPNGAIRPRLISEKNLEKQIFSETPPELKRKAYAIAGVAFKVSRTMR